MKKKLSIAIGLGLFASTITLPVALSSCKSSKLENDIKEFNYKNIAFIAKVDNSLNYSSKANGGQIIVDANENINAINDLNEKIKSLSMNDLQSEMNQLWQHIYHIMLTSVTTTTISKNIANPIQLKSMNILENGKIELTVEISYDILNSYSMETKVEEKVLTLTPKFVGKDELMNQAQQFKTIEENEISDLSTSFNVVKNLYLGNSTNNWNIEDKYNNNFDYNDPKQKSQGLFNYMVNFNNNVNSLAMISGFEINLDDALFEKNNQLNNFWIPSMTLSSIYFPTLDQNNTNPSLDINSESSNGNQDNNKPEISENEIVNKLNPKFEKLNDVGFDYLTNVLKDTNSGSIDEKIDVLNNLTGIQIITDTVRSIEFDLNNTNIVRQKNNQNYILIKIEFNDKANKLANLTYEIKLYNQWFNSNPNYEGTSNSNNTTNPNPDNKPNDEVKPPVSKPDDKPSKPDNKPETTPPPSKPNLDNELSIFSSKEEYIEGETISITASFKKKKLT